jgi:hypothetical protein
VKALVRVAVRSAEVAGVDLETTRAKDREAVAIVKMGIALSDENRMEVTCES